MRHSASDVCYFLGLDLGPTTAPTALAVLARPRVYPGDPLEARRPPYTLAHLVRFAPGTPYPEIITTLLGLLRQRPLHGAVVGVDSSGVGQAVLRLVKDGLRTGGVTCGYRPIAVTTAGGGRHVPRSELAATVQVLLQTRRLLIPRSLPDADLLVAEMMNFRNAVVNDALDPWRAGANDDLVLALAIAAWLGERALPPMVDQLEPDGVQYVM